MIPFRLSSLPVLDSHGYYKLHGFCEYQKSDTGVHGHSDMIPCDNTTRLICNGCKNRLPMKILEEGPAGAKSDREQNGKHPNARLTAPIPKKEAVDTEGKKHEPREGSKDES